MSWRVIATVMIVVFSALLIFIMATGPLHQTGDAIESADDGDGELNIPEHIDRNIRAWGNQILIIVFGLLLYGGWRVLRREATRGQL